MDQPQPGRPPLALSLPSILALSILIGGLALLLLWHSERDHQDISLHIIETPDGLEVFGTGFANSPEEAELLEKTRAQHGRPGLTAPVRITHVREAYGLGLSDGRNRRTRPGAMLLEVERTHKVHVLVLARMGGTGMYYRTGRGIEVDNRYERLGDLPPELAERLGWAPVEGLDPQQEIDRALAALGEFARVNLHLGLDEVADLIESGGGERQVQHPSGYTWVIVTGGGASAVMLIMMLGLRARLRAREWRCEDGYLR